MLSCSSLQKSGQLGYRETSNGKKNSRNMKYLCVFLTGTTWLTQSQQLPTIDVPHCRSRSWRQPVFLCCFWSSSKQESCQASQGADRTCYCWGGYKRSGHHSSQTHTHTHCSRHGKCKLFFQSDARAQMSLFITLCSCVKVVFMECVWLSLCEIDHFDVENYKYIYVCI